MGPADNDPSRSVYKTKADVVAVLTKSFADGAALIEEHADQLTRVVKDPDSGEPSLVPRLRTLRGALRPARSLLSSEWPRAAEITSFKIAFAGPGSGPH